jgi:adenylosuccinate synthase
MRHTEKEKVDYMAILAWGVNYEERGRVLLKIPKNQRQLISCNSIYASLKEKKKEIDKLINEYEEKIKKIKK